MSSSSSASMTSTTSTSTFDTYASAGAFAHVKIDEALMMYQQVTKAACANAPKYQTQQQPLLSASTHNNDPSIAFTLYPAPTWDVQDISSLHCQCIIHAPNIITLFDLADLEKQKQEEMIFALDEIERACINHLQQQFSITNKSSFESLYVYPPSCSSLVMDIVFRASSGFAVIPPQVSPVNIFSWNEIISKATRAGIEPWERTITYYLPIHHPLAQKHQHAQLVQQQQRQQQVEQITDPEWQAFEVELTQARVQAEAQAKEWMDRAVYPQQDNAHQCATTQAQIQTSQTGPSTVAATSTSTATCTSTPTSTSTAQTSTSTSTMSSTSTPSL